MNLRKRLERIERARAERKPPRAAVVLYNPTEAEVEAAQAANPGAPMVVFTTTPPNRAATESRSDHED